MIGKCAPGMWTTDSLAKALKDPPVYSRLGPSSYSFVALKADAEAWCMPCARWQLMGGAPGPATSSSWRLLTRRWQWQPLSTDRHRNHPTRQGHPSLLRRKTETHPTRGSQGRPPQLRSLHQRLRGSSPGGDALHGGEWPQTDIVCSAFVGVREGVVGGS